MAILIKVPRLGWSMDEGTFGEWLFDPGDQVKQGDLLFVLEGDKSSQDIESFDAGILHVPSTAPKPGDKVFVGQPLGFLLSQGETPPPLPEFDYIPTQESTPKKPKINRPAGPAARRLARELGVDLEKVTTSDPTGRVTRVDLESIPSNTNVQGSRQVATPRARRKATQHGINLGSLAGTGKNGRIRERDVMAATEPAASEIVPIARGNWIEPSRMRISIAARMSESRNQSVPVTLVRKANANALVDFRQLLKSKTPESSPSYNDVLLYLAAQTLAQNPMLNCCWCNNRLYQFDDINIGFAVDTKGGLLAPVIELADQKSIDEIATSTRELAQRAREGKLTEKELSMGTFTISNLGMLGIDYFTPVINTSQCAILGIGRILDEPIVVDDDVCAGKTISFSLTFDHRAVDGAPAARWLQQFCEQVEGLNPER